MHAPQNATSDDTTRDGSELRRCLRCREMFDSEWIGERICSRCKKTTAWRKGEPSPT